MRIPKKPMRNKSKHMRKLEPLFIIQNAIKEFFNENTFLEIITPPVVKNPGMETHIHPFEIYSVVNNKRMGEYLHTSPEFHMKSLLSQGYEKIFTMSYAFRDEPNSSTHRKQFLMLEWYRTQSHYEQIMLDCQNLIEFCHEKLILKKVEVLHPKIKFQKMTVNEAFKTFLGFEILDYLELDSLYGYVKENLQTIPLPPKDVLTWDDVFFLIMLNEIEPHFKNYDFLLLYEFPHHLKALSTIKNEDSRVCERFEIYARGLELCNCFNELTNLTEQIKRFEEQRNQKKELFGYELPNADVLYSALQKGLPPSAGIALGVERLLMALTGQTNPFWD